MTTVFRGLFLAALLIGPSMLAAEAAAETVVATVSGVDILRSDVEEAHTRLPGRLQGMALESVYGLLINSLIDSKLVAREARANGLDEDDRVKKLMARIEDQVLERIFMTDYIEARLDDMTLKERYKKLLAETPAEEEIRARHILLETEQAAKGVIVELGGGADFAELAKQHSTGPSAPNGGDLGFFAPEQMVPAFSAAAFSLDKGGHTLVPVKTRFGWHVIKVEEKRNAKPPTFEEAEPELRMALSSDIATEYLSGLREKADVKRYNLDGSAMQEAN